MISIIDFFFNFFIAVFTKPPNGLQKRQVAFLHTYTPFRIDATLTLTTYHRTAHNIE